MPAITVYMNCDTRLAINLQMFNLSENDEFVFVIKNHSYVDSPYAFLRRFRADSIDENGEVIFKITPEESKRIKPGAIYNFSVLINALNKRAPTEYKKLTDNGNVIVEYGAHDLALPEEEQPLTGDSFQIMDIRLEDPNTVVEALSPNDTIVSASVIKVSDTEEA
jgi:hypothetical protein